MSYILDSLKKSEKERRSIHGSVASSLSSPAFLDNVKSTSYKWPVFSVLIVLVLGCTVYSYQKYFWQNDIAVQGVQNSTKQKVFAINEPSLAKQEAVLLYEQAVKQKTRPEIDSLYENIKSESISLQSDVYESTDVNGDFPTALPELPSVGITATTTVSDSKSRVSSVTIPSIYDIDQLTKKNIPAIDYGAHIYATDNKSGFVILNGARRRAGDKLENGIYVERILEDSVVLSYNGIVFSLPSMKSWAGD